MLIKFPTKTPHARASADSTGYKSGRNSDLGIPETRSTSKTLSGGTSSHCETACGVMPSGAASPAKPPAASIARRSASFLSLMAGNSSIALVSSQASLHCAYQASLYAIGVPKEMTIGVRIKLARKRIDGLTQVKLGEAVGATGGAVSNWERNSERPDPDKYPKLRKALRVPYKWLLEGNTPPPEPDDPLVLLEDLTEPERKALFASINKIGLGSYRAA
jgi:transcriptional regulator with XRE-family HTH domain